jgi:hypothetical protein
MRKTFVAAAVATIFSAGAFLASGANAMTLTAPAGMRLATEGANAVEPIRHRCYRLRSGRLVCERHRGVVAVAPSYGFYGSPYYYGPTVGIGLGYGGWWGGYGYGGWGGHSVVRSRTVVHRHHHHRGRR